MTDQMAVSELTYRVQSSDTQYRNDIYKYTTERIGAIQ